MTARTSGPFEAEDEAHAAAVARATTFGDPSRPAEIYAPDAEGRFRLDLQPAVAEQGELGRDRQQHHRRLEGEAACRWA